MLDPAGGQSLCQQPIPLDHEMVYYSDLSSISWNLQRFARRGLIQAIQHTCQ